MCSGSHLYIVLFSNCSNGGQRWFIELLLWHEWSRVIVNNVNREWTHDQNRATKLGQMFFLTFNISTFFVKAHNWNSNGRPLPPPKKNTHTHKKTGSYIFHLQVWTFSLNFLFHAFLIIIYFFFNNFGVGGVGDDIFFDLHHALGMQLREPLPPSISRCQSLLAFSSHM